MLSVHFFEKTNSFLHIHISYIHDMLCTNLEWCTDKNTDMWNVVIFQDCICTASHDQTVFCPCKVADQITHIEENCILL